MPLDFSILLDYAKPFAIMMGVILVLILGGSVLVDQGVSEQLVFFSIIGLIFVGVLAVSLKEFL